MLQASSLNNNDYNNNNNNNVSSNNNFTNNNNYTHERNTHSGNMYSYREDSINEPPKESNAIRRSIGAGFNPNINNQPFSHDLSRKQPPKYLEQFQESFDKRDKRNKNNILGQSSEMRIPQPENMEILNSVPKLDETNKNKLYRRRPNQNNGYSYLITYIIIGVLHAVMILLIGLFFEFKLKLKDENFELKYNHIYIFFKDIHFFIFIGFGCLFAALRDHQWTSLFLVLILGTLAIEFSFFDYYFWGNTFSKVKWQKININFSILSGIEYNAAAALITLGALLGKLSLLQYVIIIFFETFFGSLNFFLCYEKLKAVDNGGSLFIHMFGALFGLSVSCVLFCLDSEFLKINNNPHMTSNYCSNMIGIIGTIFLWLFFPSFNTANIQMKNFSTIFGQEYEDSKYIIENMRYRGIINTYLSMLGSLLSSFIITPLFYKGKLKMEHLLHASYVGGIVIGGCCTICSSAWSAVVIGFCGGGVTILFLWKIKHILHGIKLEDTIGVLEIFGIPGLLGGIFTCIFLGNMSNKNAWGDGAVKTIFNTSSNSSAVKAGLHIASIFITLGISVVSGIVTGFVAKVMTCARIHRYFVDSEFFVEEEGVVLPEFEYQDENESGSNLDSSGNKLDPIGKEVNINNNNVNRHIDSNNINNNMNNNNNNNNNNNQESENDDEEIA